MRLFAAVTPPEHVLDHLDGALGAVRGAPAGTATAVRWSARETWHLTVAFFGELPDGAVPGLADDLALIGASTAPYELRLRGAGVFAHRTVWVGVSGDVDAQRVLSGRVREAGESAGAPARRPSARAPAPDRRPGEGGRTSARPSRRAAGGLVGSGRCRTVRGHRRCGGRRAGARARRVRGADLVGGPPRAGPVDPRGRPRGWTVVRDRGRIPVRRLRLTWHHGRRDSAATAGRWWSPISVARSRAAPLTRT